VTQPNDSRRLERLQEVRSGMEVLHVDALAERGGRAFSTEETVTMVDRPVQNRDLSGFSVARK
jgi:hypothetical protein